MSGRVNWYFELGRLYLAAGRDRNGRPVIEVGIGERLAAELPLVSGPLSIALSFDRLLVWPHWTTTRSPRARYAIAVGPVLADIRH